MQGSGPLATELTGWVEGTQVSRVVAPPGNRRAARANAGRLAVRRPVSCVVHRRVLVAAVGSHSQADFHADAESHASPPRRSPTPSRKPPTPKPTPLGMEPTPVNAVIKVSPDAVDNPATRATAVKELLVRLNGWLRDHHLLAGPRDS